jgi:hypothetical protein
MPPIQAHNKIFASFGIHAGGFNRIVDFDARIFIPPSAYLKPAIASTNMP